MALCAAVSAPDIRENIELAGELVNLSSSANQVDTTKTKLLRVRRDILLVAERVQTVERSQFRRKTHVFWIFVLFAIVFVILIALFALYFHLYFGYHHGS